MGYLPSLDRHRYDDSLPPSLAPHPLGEYLDESRAFTREFLRSFSAKYGNKLWVCFGDGKEVGGGLSLALIKGGV